MVHSLGTMIWLCWILCWILPFVGANAFDGGGGPPGGFGGGPPGGFGGKGFGGGRGKGKGKGFGRGGFRGGKFGKGDGRNGGDGDQDADQQAAQAQDPSQSAAPQVSAAVESTSAAAPATPLTVSIDSSAAAATTNSVASVASPVPATSLAAVAPTSSVAGFEEPSSIQNAFGDGSTTAVPLAGIPIAAPTSTVNNAATTSSPFVQFPSTMSTVTASMTVVITNTAAPAQGTQAASSTLDLAPLSTSPGKTMSASAQAGMGIGITFGVLSVAGVTGLYLWRRRRNQRMARNSFTRRGDGLAGFFRLRSRNDDRNDAEWSIESAEKVEIVRGGSAKSVRTGSRSDSPGSDSPPGPPPRFPMGGEGGGVGLMKVGMKVPDRKPNPALTSNPPVSPSEFPTPPSSRGSPEPGTVIKKDEEKKKSWPLPE